MICYIMCILLWIAYLWLDCMVVAYAFEPRRDSVRQAGIILGLMAAQLPAAVLKFLFNDNVLVRYGAMIAAVSYTHLDVYKRQGRKERSHDLHAAEADR